MRLDLHGETYVYLIGRKSDFRLMTSALSRYPLHNNLVLLKKCISVKLEYINKIKQIVYGNYMSYNEYVACTPVIYGYNKSLKAKKDYIDFIMRYYDKNED